MSERFRAVEPGKIAAIVTVLETTGRPAPRAVPALSNAEIIAWDEPEADRYLELYRRIGAEHLWFSRLYMERDELEDLLASPETAIYSLRVGGIDEGILELDFSQSGSCEIKYFGVSTDLQGTGAARLLMNHAISAAFARPINRLWLHTNTIDHPRALAFYRRTGFQPIEQRIEIADDPRLNGKLPRDTAPHVPIFE